MKKMKKKKSNDKKRISQIYWNPSIQKNSSSGFVCNQVKYLVVYEFTVKNSNLIKKNFSNLCRIRIITFGLPNLLNKNS